MHRLRQGRGATYDRWRPVHMLLPDRDFRAQNSSTRLRRVSAAALDPSAAARQTPAPFPLETWAALRAPPSPASVRRCPGQVVVPCRDSLQLASLPERFAPPVAAARFGGKLQRRSPGRRWGTATRLWFPRPTATCS